MVSGFVSQMMKNHRSHQVLRSIPYRTVLPWSSGSNTDPSLNKVGEHHYFHN